MKSERTILPPHQNRDRLITRLFQASDLAEVCRFIAGLNHQPEHHIAYFGTKPDEIEYYLLEEQTVPPQESYVLAYLESCLAGVIGLEYDLELLRAWIEGPLISYPDWERLAEILYSRIVDIIPEGINDYELAADTRNKNLERFAENHGYRSSGESALLVFKRFSLGNLPAVSESKVTPAFAGQFQNLHDKLFPGTYYNGKQLYEKIDETHQVFTASEAGRLQGYVFAYVAPEIGDAYIDFIGVEENDRRRGVGKRLLISALHWIFTFNEVRQVGLSVNVENIAAVNLYQSCGFYYERTLRGYRLKFPSA